MNYRRKVSMHIYSIHRPRFFFKDTNLFYNIHVVPWIAIKGNIRRWCYTFHFYLLLQVHSLLPVMTYGWQNRHFASLHAIVGLKADKTKFIESFCRPHWLQKLNLIKLSRGWSTSALINIRNNQFIFSHAEENVSTQLEWKVRLMNF